MGQPATRLLPEPRHALLGPPRGSGKARRLADGVACSDPRSLPTPRGYPLAGLENLWGSPRRLGDDGTCRAIR